jgi:hypothetical protein
LGTWRSPNNWEQHNKNHNLMRKATEIRTPTGSAATVRSRIFRLSCLSQNMNVTKHRTSVACCWGRHSSDTWFRGRYWDRRWRLKETAHWGTLWFALLTKYCYGYQIAKDERGKTCSPYGAEGKYRQGMVEETRRKRPTRTVEQDGRVWNGLVWLRIGTRSGLLWTW